ncbi:MAG TPA: DUF3152 domain-containing protein [Nannocystaceae bacterium]|nr:DUF3152 domain-containing protein [Nannocystaceae bacterium]
MIEMQMMMGLASWLAVLIGGAAAPVVTEQPRKTERIDDAEFVVVPAPARPVHAEDVTVRVLVEAKYADEADAFAWAVEEALGDAAGWAAAGHRFVVVDGDAEITVVLAKPKTVDELCAPLVTGGSFSCGRKGRAVINARRWHDGASTYRGQLAAYRTYVINHEVGHLLGFEHAACPGKGRRAPVMLQQTKSLAGCKRSSHPSTAEIARMASTPLRYANGRTGKSREHVEVIAREAANAITRRAPALP